MAHDIFDITTYSAGSSLQCALQFEVGRLFIRNGQLTFEGNADESAKHFLDLASKVFADYIAEQRAEAVREYCARLEQEKRNGA